MATKKEIIETLGAAGIPHNPSDSVAILKSLLHPEDAPMADTIEEDEAPTQKVTKEQKARWDAFLEKHKAQSPEKHAARLKAGELEMPVNF